MQPHVRATRLLAELIGTAFLLMTVVGSGIMAETLADGNIAVALLCNTVPTGAILVVLITFLGPISGAHFNPAVTLAFALRREITLTDSGAYVAVQISGGLLGVVLAHAMFEQSLWQASQSVRTGYGQWLGEGVATFGLVLVILGTLRVRASAVPAMVGLYITAAYWFTSSTSFANPAVTIARSISNTFAGIRVDDVPAFLVAQCIGAVLAVLIAHLLTPPPVAADGDHVGQ